MELNDRIRERRIALNMSQDELAQKLGYKSRSSINKIESGAHDLPLSKVEEIAACLDTTPGYLMGWESDGGVPTAPAVRIPVYGKVAAGIPIAAVTDFTSEDPDDWEEIPAQMARSGEYIALRIDGDSMEPRIRKGDVVIVRLQEQVESGDIAIVFVNGDDAVCKRVRWTDAGLTLISSNPSYEPLFYTPAEVESLPVRFLGKVVELRGKL